MNKQFQLYNEKEKKFEDPDILVHKEEADKRNKILNSYHESFSWREVQIKKEYKND